MAELPEARIAMDSVKGVPSTEPSMEDILASIRRILNDDAPSQHELPPAAEEEILVLDDTMLAKPANDHVHGRPTLVKASTETLAPPPTPPLDSHVLEAVASPERRPEPTPERRPEPTPERRPEPTPERRPEPVAERRPEPTPERRPEPVAERRPEPVAQRRPETVSEQRAEPVAERRPEPVAKLRPEPPAEPPVLTEPAIPHPPEPPAPINEGVTEMAEVAPHPATTPQDGLLAPQTKSAAGAALASLVQKVSDERVVPVYRNGPTIEDLVREEIRPVLKAWLDNQLPGMVERLVRAEIQRLTTNL